jgi:hypothetical protein
MTGRDTDVAAWAAEQAEKLRDAARTGTNLPLDWEHIAEEIESVGVSQRTALRSQIFRIVRHLLKLQFSPASDPRSSVVASYDLRWRNSIRDGRKQVDDLLTDSPSLRSQVEPVLAQEMSKAGKRAIEDMREHGEVGGDTEAALRAARYTPEQVLGDWFPP